MKLFLAFIYFVAYAWANQAVGSCDWCQNQRSAAQIFNEAQNVVVFSVDQPGVLSPSYTPGTNGRSMTYRSFDYIRPEKQSSDCQATDKVVALRQIVKRNPEDVACRDTLIPGQFYRVSGYCENGYFFADSCGLMDRIARPGDASDVAAPRQPDDLDNEGQVDMRTGLNDLLRSLPARVRPMGKRILLRLLKRAHLKTHWLKMEKMRGRLMKLRNWRRRRRKQKKGRGNRFRKLIQGFGKWRNRLQRLKKMRRNFKNSRSFMERLRQGALEVRRGLGRLKRGANVKALRRSLRRLALQIRRLEQKKIHLTNKANQLHEGVQILENGYPGQEGPPLPSNEGGDEGGDARKSRGSKLAIWRKGLLRRLTPDVRPTAMALLRSLFKARLRRFRRNKQRKFRSFGGVNPYRRLFEKIRRRRRRRRRRRSRGGNSDDDGQGGSVNPFRRIFRKYRRMRLRLNNANPFKRRIRRNNGTRNPFR